MLRSALFSTTLLFHFTSFSQDAAAIFKNNVESTVTIKTDLKQGSGFFVSEDEIVTNYHVIRGASDGNCYVFNSDIPLKIKGYLAVDFKNDLALLKVDANAKKPITFSTKEVITGQKVYVIGSPEGLTATISDGLVSGQREFDGVKLIQISAAISPGSSGGVILNTEGELIGVAVSQLKEGQNLNFAIPKEFVLALMASKEAEPKPLADLLNNDNNANFDSNWTQADRDEFINSCVKEASGSLSEDVALKYCSCTAEKLEVKYPDVNDVAKLSQDELMVVVNQCLGLDTKNAKTYAGATAWSQPVFDAYMNSCVEQSKTMFSEEKSIDYCACTAEKLQKKYPDEQKLSTISTEQIQKVAKKCKGKIK